MKKRFDLDKFVEVWQKADSTQDVVKIFGLKRETLTAKAWECRKNGVKLKSMRKGPRAKTIDWTRLAKLAEKYKKAS